MSEGYCRCGCGEKTRVFRGKPRLYVQHHHDHGRMPRKPVRFGIMDGEEVAFIPLPYGQEAIVSKLDFDLVRGISWNCADGYASGGRPMTRMHRLLLGLTGRHIEADHINGNKLDNRRSNLRIANHSQNACNTPKRRDNTSGFKGAHFNKVLGKWVAHITINRKQRHLGVFATPEEAHAAYAAAAKEHHGEFARIA